MEKIKLFIKRISDDHVSAYAAQSAYFILLSFIPFILLLMTLVRYTPLTQTMVLDMVVNVVPIEFQNFVKVIILEVYTKSLSVVPFTAIMTLWTAGKGIQGLTNGLNCVFQIEESRGYIRARIRSAIYTLLFILCIVITLILLVFGNSIQILLEMHVPLISEITEIILRMSRIFSVLFLALVFVLMYKYLPNHKMSLKKQIPGAVVAAVAWSVFSQVFSLYLQYFHTGKMYGSLTTVIMIMLWMYFCMFIFLLGAEINSFFLDR